MTEISEPGIPALRRSLLFVPGDDLRKLERSLGSGADSLVFDLEDAVAPERKEVARKNVAELLRQQSLNDSEAAVRINAPGSPFFDEDLHAVVAAGAGAIMLPKCAGQEDVAELAHRLDRLEAASHSACVPTRILALVESALGILQAHASASASPRLEALCFGHVDFALDLGLAEIRADADSIHHARCSLVLAAKAAGKAPIDHVCLSVADENAMRSETLAGLRLGCEGKLCIHPRQVRIANEVYTPTAEQIANASRVVEAAESAAARGQSVFRLDGKMIDAPVVGAQRKVLARARRAGLPVHDPGTS